MNITLMLGGPSAEREVSIRSGRAVATALRGRGHTLHELDPQAPDWRLPADTEIVFLALHGTYGEDGAVQRRLEAMGVPYTGCGPEASRLAFDKVLTKECLFKAGVPTAPYLMLESTQAPWPQGWHPPLVIKPVCQGSSVGLQFVREPAEWGSALADSLRYDARVLVEELIVGREATVAILADQALPVVEVRPRQGSYDYTNKYTKGATDYFCPAPFDPSTTQRIQGAALGAFRAVGGRDYARVDVMVRGDGSPLVLEVNTLPGMTDTSLFPMAAAAAGLDYASLCQRMVDLALNRPRAGCRDAPGPAGARARAAH
jgi:D-alanine-D-alanine ligase